MPEENKDVQSGKDGGSQSPSQSQTVDVDSIVSKAEAAARKAVEEASKDISKQAVDAIASKFSDKETKQEIHPLIREFIKDPDALLRANRELGAQETLEILQGAEAQKKADAEAIAPILDEYPELRSKIGYVEYEADNSYRENPKLSRAEHIKRGAEKAAQQLGLKKLTEEEKQKRKADAAIPSTGGGASGTVAERDRSQEAKDFIKLRTEAANAPRIRKSAA